MAQNSLPTPDTTSAKNNDQDQLKPDKGKKFKKVLQPKRTIRDKAGEWEVVDAKRDSVLVQKAIYTDSDSSEGESQSD